MGEPRVLLTGGFGFYGRHIILALREQFPNADIYVLDKHIPDDLDESIKSEIVDSFEVDITLLSEIRRAFTQVHPDVVVHTAGLNPTPLEERYRRRLQTQLWAVNVDGTRNMLQAAAESGCKAFVYTSSCCVVTDDLHGYFANINEDWPLSRTSLMYGESKVAAEDLVAAADSETMATCTIRPAVTFGEGDYILVPSIHACIAKRETPFRLGNGLNLWDVVYVGNVAYAHSLAVKNLLTTKSAHGQSFFIQNNEPISFREFCLAIWKEFGHYPPFEIEIPASLGLIVGGMSEVWTWLTGGTTTISRGSVLDACAMRYASGDKAKRVLGYEARVGLEVGLKRSCAEYAERLKKKDPLLR